MVNIFQTCLGHHHVLAEGILAGLDHCRGHGLAETCARHDERPKQGGLRRPGRLGKEHGAVEDLHWSSGDVDERVGRPNHLS